MYSGKSGCVRANWLYSGKSKVVVFVFRPNSGGCILVFAKVVVFQKWVKSCCFRAKVVVFGQELLHSG